MSSDFEGFGKGGGANSKAGLSIQYEFDIKSNSICDIDLTSAIARDSKDAICKKEDICKGDLVIRDLGYYSDAVIENFINKKAYFISKLYHNVSVRQNLDDKVKIDFGQIYEQMTAKGQQQLDINVYIGKKRHPVRLIIAMMPENIYERRIRQKNKENKSIGYNTSDEYKRRAHFNLFICNIPQSECNCDAICKLYRIRWQIELVFKTWKSIMYIDDLRKMKKDRLVTTIYAKLLWIFINWKIVSECRNEFYLNDGRILSIFKCFQTLKENSNLLRRRLFRPSKNIKNLLLDIIALLKRKHWVEKRNNRYNIEDIFGLMFCNSANNAYI